MTSDDLSLFLSPQPSKLDAVLRITHNLRWYRVICIFALVVEIIQFRLCKIRIFYVLRSGLSLHFRFCTSPCHMCLCVHPPVSWKGLCLLCCYFCILKLFSNCGQMQQGLLLMHLIFHLHLKKAIYPNTSFAYVRITIFRLLTSDY